MRRSFIAFIIFIISGAALSAQSGDRDLRLTMKNQGYEREYRLYIPEGVGEGSPLVIALHGYGGGIEKMPSALITTAKAHGYAICIPQGLKDPAGKPGWNVGYPSQEGITVDDVDFVCTLARKLRKEYGFSKSATFLTGMSNGGEMCYLTAMRKPKAFTAVASIAGLSLLWMFEKYPVSGPVPFMEVHGTEDRTSEWLGDPDNAGGWGAYAPVPVAVGRVVNADGCVSQTVEELPVREGRNKVTLYKFGRGIPAANGRPMEVWLYEVKGGNHSWSDADMDTYEETWKFFSKWM